MIWMNQPFWMICLGSDSLPKCSRCHQEVEFIVPDYDVCKDCVLEVQIASLSKRENREKAKSKAWETRRRNREKRQS